MSTAHFSLQSATAFSESLIWELSRKYYNTTGIDAWRDGTVPHNITSNALVGKTYAGLILGFLKDLARKGQTKETVYILELGAGHGRLAFHVLKHLDVILEEEEMELPPFCFVLSDIVESNLTYFAHHPQFQPYFKKGVLDVSYFDGVGSTALNLVFAQRTIRPNKLEQPIVALGNYFFDSLPFDVFRLKDKQLFSCDISLASKFAPLNPSTKLEEVELTFHEKEIKLPYYKNEFLNDLLASYQQQLPDTYLYFPVRAFDCITNVQNLSKQGLMLIVMDKGYRHLNDLGKAKAPDMVVHGSLSFWVNFHALTAFCEQQNGKALFSKTTNIDLELACLLFLKDSHRYPTTQTTFSRSVSDFSPSDYNSIKKFAYQNIANAQLADLLPIIRLSAHDSTFFTNILPRIKQLSKRVSFAQRQQLAETMHRVWEMYFSLQETDMDLAYEIGGLFYDLGFYKDALSYFNASLSIYGDKADIYYNAALCYYQLRADDLFLQTKQMGRNKFPASTLFDHLDKLDMNA